MPAGTGFNQTAEAGMSPSELARLEYLEDNEYKILYFASISAATGTITIPTGATILLDQFYSGGDAIVETLINGQPSEQSPVTAGGAVVSVSSFDTSGNYTLSGTPSSYPVALVYILKIKAVDYQNLVTANIMAMDEISPVSQTITNGVTDKAPSEDAVYDALATKQDGLIFKQNTTITHTGTTTPTVIASFPIPINFNEANDFWHIWGMCGVDITGGGPGNNQIRMYIGPNPTDIAGATYTASIFVSSTLRTYPIARTFVFKNSLTTFEGSALTTDNMQTDYTTYSNAPASVTIDFSTQKYLHILGILANAGNIIYLRSLYSKILR